MPQKKKVRTKKREKKLIHEGKGFITSTFNNTIISLTDGKGNVISWGSSGTAGFKGFPQGHALCSADGCAGCCSQGQRTWIATGRSVRTWSGKRS